MSYFSRELETLMQEKNISNYAEMARVSGLSEALFSRAKNVGDKISFKAVRKIAAALGREPTIHARLLFARMREELTPPGGTLIKLEMAGAGEPVASPAPDYLARLPRQHEAAIRNTVAAMPFDAGFRDTILWLGNDVAPRILNSSPGTGSGRTGSGDTAHLDKSVAENVKRGDKKRRQPGRE